MASPDLSHELHALRPTTTWPPTPDLTATVVARLPQPAPAAAPRRAPRRLAIAVLVALLALPTAAFALPGPRHAILDALGLRHVTVERRAAPADSAARDPHLGDRTTLAAATRAAGFVPRIPEALGPPSRVYVRGTTVTFAYNKPKPLLFAQTTGRLNHISLDKVIAVEAYARAVRVAGAPGMFLAAPHAYRWSDATGPLVRSGPALIWERGGRVFRLEGEPSVRRALAIATSAH
jgi:hypothetical protein